MRGGFSAIGERQSEFDASKISNFEKDEKPIPTNVANIIS